MKLVIYIYLCLCSGMDIHGGQQTALRDKLSQPPPGEEEAKHSTKIDKNDIRAIKQGCTNGLHFCVNVLGDLEMFHMVSGLLEIMRPLSEMHSEQSHKLRDFVACCDWYVGQACGAGLAVIIQVASQLSSQHVMQAAGLHFDGELPSGLLWSSMTTEHPLIALEDAVASHLGILALACVKNTLRSAHWHLSSYPGKFAALLEPSRASHTLEVMKQDWHLWEQVQERQGAFWQKFRARSVFRMLVVQKICLIAKEAGFTLVDKLTDAVRSLFSTFGQSNIIEVGVNVSKKFAESNSAKKVANMKRWASLFESSVAEGWLRYMHLPGWQSAVVPRGMFNARTPPSFFSASLKSASMNFNSVAGNAPPTWHSPAPKNEVQYANDLALTRECASRDNWGCVHKLWLSCLLPDCCFIIRDLLDGPGSKWYWCLGDPGISGKIGWPLLEQTVNEVMLYSLRLDITAADPRWLFIIDLKRLEARRVEFISPVGQAVRIVATPTCKACGLLECAALHAFYKMPKAALLQLSRHVSASGLDSKDSLFQVCYGLMKHALPHHPEEELLTILECRLAENQFKDLQHWLQEDGLHWLHKEDQEEVRKEKDKEKGTAARGTTEDAKQSFVSELRCRRQSLKQGQAAVATAGRGRKRSATPSASSHVAPAMTYGPCPDWVLPELSEGQVDAVLPPGFKAYRDTFNKRWQLSWDKGRSRRGRSWQLYGGPGSAKLIVEHAWHVHKERTGEVCPILGIVANELVA